MGWDDNALCFQNAIQTAVNESVKSQAHPLDAVVRLLPCFVVSFVSVVFAAASWSMQQVTLAWTLITASTVTVTIVANWISRNMKTCECI